MEEFMLTDGFLKPLQSWIGDTFDFDGRFASRTGQAAGGRTAVLMLIPVFGGRSVPSGRRLRT